MDDTILLKFIFLGIGGIIPGAFLVAGLYYLNRKKKRNALAKLVAK